MKQLFGLDTGSAQYGFEHSKISFFTVIIHTGVRLSEFTLNVEFITHCLNFTLEFCSPICTDYLNIPNRSRVSQKCLNILQASLLDVRT